MRESATPSAYLGQVLHFAFRKTVTYTDFFSTLVGVLVPAFLLVAHKPSMSDWLPGAGAWCVIIVVGGSALLRLITAPYFVWREQQKNIGELEEKLSRPDEQIRTALDQTIAKSRIEIMGYATRMSHPDFMRGRSADDLKAAFEHEGVVQHVHLLAYDHEFQKLWSEFKEAIFWNARLAPKMPDYVYDPKMIEYHKGQIERYWQNGDKKINALRDQLSRHLFMKG